jgi:hypothetical protein
MTGFTTTQIECPRCGKRVRLEFRRQRQDWYIQSHERPGGRACCRNLQVRYTLMDYAADRLKRLEEMLR